MAEVYGEKYHYYDHDTDLVNETPPIQNTRYEAFDAEDVRLLFCVAQQINDEAAAKTIEVRWIIDGNTYVEVITAASGTVYYIYRHPLQGAGAASGLSNTTTANNAGFQTDKRGHSFMVDVAITAVVGTNQILNLWCTRETLELT